MVSSFDILRARLGGGSGAKTEAKPASTKSGLLLERAMFAMQNSGPMGKTLAQVAQAAAKPILRKLEDAENEAVAARYCGILGQLLIDAGDASIDYDEFERRLSVLESEFFA